MSPEILYEGRYSSAHSHIRTFEGTFVRTKVLYIHVRTYDSLNSLYCHMYVQEIC